MFDKTEAELNQELDDLSAQIDEAKAHGDDENAIYYEWLYWNLIDRIDAATRENRNP